MISSRHYLNINLCLIIYTAGVLISSLVVASNEIEETCWNQKYTICNELEDEYTVICSAIFPTFNAYRHKPKSLFICNWINNTFDPRLLKDSRFIHVKNLSIHAPLDDANQQQIDFISGRQFSHVFPKGLIIERLNLSRLGLITLSPEGLFDKLSLSLREIDLSYNLLTFLLPTTIKPLTQLNIALFNGNPWDCNIHFLWLLDSTKVNDKLTDLSKWTCGPDKLSGRPVLPVLQMMKSLNSKCPSHIPYNCTCELENFVRRRIPPDDINNKHKLSEWISFTTVNCSNRNLYRMPPYLPNNTTKLLLQNNMISDIRPLVDNPHYKSVLDVFLDQNQIRNIAALEGSEWLTSVRVLSLRENQLAQIPTYALTNAFQKNKNLASIYLGNNQWSCDCMFTPGFQNLLAQYQSVIRDPNDIKCAKTENDENSLLPVIEVTLTNLCKQKDSSITSLDILNIGLALLIILVLGKLAYDYWAFKRSGRLPWLVAKMP